MFVVDGLYGVVCNVFEYTSLWFPSYSFLNSANNHWQQRESFLECFLYASTAFSLDPNMIRPSLSLFRL